jgi:predicted O-methyltransferase YrrM
MRYDITNTQIEDYIAALMPPRRDVFAELEQRAYRRGLPLLGPVEGQLLCMLAQSIGASEALEVGTATGYAAMWLLQAVAPAGGRLTAIEQQPDRYRLAREFVDRAGFGDQLIIHQGLWSDVLPTLEGPYDIIFLDVLRSMREAEQALQALELCMPLLRVGGLLVGDNVLCSAQVLEEDAPPTVRGIQNFNRAIMRHPQLDSVIIPLRDGVSISRKKIAA